MPRLSENHYLRKCYFEREQVPTQSVMINKMQPPLAKVYFKSMNRKLKVLAGLEPPMQGGGSDWYIPPEQVLDGKLVMQPIKKEYLQKLGYDGIAAFGEQLVADRRKRMEEEKQKVLVESDLNWKQTIELNCRQQWEDASKKAALANTDSIKSAFHDFTTMYTSSINRIENLLFDASIKEIEQMREATFKKMKAHYEDLLNKQATMLYDRYTKRLNEEKEILKQNFMKNIEEARTMLGNQLHDINLDKHIAVEKLRQLLKCLNLACQVYVALKEREECKKETELSQYIHRKTVRALEENIAMKDFEIRLEKEKERKRQEFNMIWKKKICEVVKKFQMFATYCLNELPNHADFFIDMEKLMMLQLNEAVENPVAESIIVADDEPAFHTPIPRPHPFYVFCDKGYKPDLDQDLCPKHCTSSASQLPVVVVNERYIYAACDNFEVFTDKITEFINGRRGEDIDFEDHHNYDLDVPVTITKSQQLLDLKLQSSIMQVLQEELPNVKEVPIECCMCCKPYCFCSPLHFSKMDLHYSAEETKTPSLKSIPSGNKIDSRSVELVHEREPKWESYMKYITPTRCHCGKRAKKHLEEHLPPYMRNMSMYDQPSLPNYEMCSLAVLQTMVKKAQRKRVQPPPEIVEPKTRDVGTEYTGQSFEKLCTCFSDQELKLLFQQIMNDLDAGKDQFNVVDGDVTPSYLSRQMSSFATECAHTLKSLLDESPQLQEIFKKPDCKYD